MLVKQKQKDLVINISGEHVYFKVTVIPVVSKLEK